MCSLSKSHKFLPAPKRIDIYFSRFIAISQGKFRAYVGLFSFIVWEIIFNSHPAAYTLRTLVAWTVSLYVYRAQTKSFAAYSLRCNVHHATKKKTKWHWIVLLLFLTFFSGLCYILRYLDKYGTRALGETSTASLFSRKLSNR